VFSNGSALRMANTLVSLQWMQLRDNALQEPFAKRYPRFL